MSDNHLFQDCLLIEDDPGHEMIIKRALLMFVAEVVSRNNFSAAKQFLKSSRPEIIVTDLNLPDSMAAGHIKILRETYPEIPIVVLTASTSLHDAVEAMKQGARDFLVKHFDKDFKDILGLSLARLASALEIEKERSSLQRQMQVLRKAIENSVDGLAVVDKLGNVIYANSAFHSFTERCGGDGKNLLGFFSENVNRHVSLRESLEKNLSSLAPGGSWQTEISFKTEKRLAYNLSLSAIRLQSSENSAELEVKVSGTEECVVWVRDISEQKRREKFQREVLSTTTHDLKGPLGAIVISSELAGELVGSNKKAHDLIVRIASSAQGALNLIDEFLSARRIQEGTYLLRPLLQKVQPIIEEALSGYETIAKARDIQLKTEILDLDLHANVDKLGLIRVIGNLVSNALKFTPKLGMVEVRAWSQGEYVHISVADTGSGMEPAEIQKLFELFARLERHREVDGSGIGLFVVKSIVNAHGGKIEVTSQLGQGTSFEILLPLSPPVNERGELISLDFA